MATKAKSPEDIRKDIELRAYLIWDREGRPHGRDAEHWQRAEAEILGSLPAKKAPAKKLASPKKAKAVKPPEAKPAAAKPAAPKAAAKTKPPKG